MTNSQRLATVREAIGTWIRQQGQAGDEMASGELTSESFLIRGEFFCGKRFWTSSHTAVWFIEEDELKISSLCNKSAVSVRGSEIDEILDERPETKIIAIRPEIDRASESSQDEDRKAA